MAQPPDIPDPIRERLLAQQKRLKFVRISFAVTAVLAVAMMFAATAYQGLTPSFRVVTLLEAAPDDQGRFQGLLLDQSLESPTSAARGSFRFARLTPEGVRHGRQFEGVREGATLLPGLRATVLFCEQMVEFDLAGEISPQWPGVSKTASLTIGESNGSPRAAVCEGTPWLCWSTGSKILTRPLQEPEIRPATVAELERPIASLDLVAAGGRLYLVSLERTTGKLTLYVFTPGLQEMVEQAEGARAPVNAVIAVDAEPPPKRKRATVEHKLAEKGEQVTAEVRAFSLAVVGERPVIALTRKNDPRREWEFWRLEGPGQWTNLKQRPPGANQNPLGIGGLGFMSLAATGEKLAAIYSDGSVIKLALGTPKDGEFSWEARELALEPARGLTAVLVWLGAFGLVLLLLAGQGVWLLLNRQQELDKTLAGILAAGNRAAKGSDKAAAQKDEPKLLYAGHFSRGIALLIDLLVTSPIIILLKQVYGYEWSQAYGFFYFGPIYGAGSGVVHILQGTLVTLSVLAAYSLVCELLWGRTLGKALLHLRVVDAKGEAPAGWQIAVRNLVRILELAHWSLLLLPLGVMLLSGKQQRLGDLLARTYVVVDVAPEEQADDMDIS